MVIGVLGAYGRLGKTLVAMGCQPILSNLLDYDTLKREIDKVKPDVIINTAGITDVDYCERYIVDSYKINAFSLENIRKIFDKYFVQISTDFVFNGINGPYKEDAEANPINTYGFSKMTAEIITKERFCKHLIVRTTNLYEANFDKLNFAMWVYKNITNEQFIKVSKVFKGNPTYIPHLAKGILQAINKNIYGTLNIVGQDNLSRYDFAELIIRHFQLDNRFLSYGDVFGLAKRPENGGLDVTKAESLGIDIYPVHVGLIDFGEKINEFSKTKS